MAEAPKKGQKTEKVEKRTAADEIKDIEDQIKKTQYNKATQHHIGLLKAKIAKLREKQENKGKGGKKGEGYSVKRSGDGTVILIGFPSVGKSTLLNQITNAKSATAAYAFTTLTCIPGSMEYNSAKIQILDVPGIVKGAAAGTGRGKEVLAVVRSADLVLFVIDIFDLDALEVLKKELYDTNLRVNKKKPDVVIKKEMRGGIEIYSTLKLTKIDEPTILAVMREYKITNATVLIRSDIDVDELIDCIEGNRKYLPAIVAINKVDMVHHSLVDHALEKIPGAIPISAQKGLNMERLKQSIYDGLNFERVYLKEVGKKPDLDVPLIVMKGSSVKAICDKLHRDFVSKFKFARVWGSSKFPGQKLGIDYILQDKDILEIHLR